MNFKIKYILRMFNNNKGEVINAFPFYIIIVSHYINEGYIYFFIRKILSFLENILF